MKIIFANNYYYIRGGSERGFFDEMQILWEKGHYVLPFSRHFSQNIENLKYFPSPIDYENVPIYKRLFAAFSLIYSPTCARYFGKLLDRELPDIVHAHNIYGRLTTSIIQAAKKRNIPVVLTLHDYKLICPSYLMLREGKICELCKGKRFY
ncbi:MAG TPA: glycosyltransferase family 1 protein, partial [Candidatus Desulfofervidus auxilii]|nr:glycosyltransferase family 1 protein [Candidatus Desulfofervidus auxilii]